jgi:hypothetical protein
VRGDEVVGKVLYLEEPRPLGEHAHVAGTVPELVFQRQVTEQGFVDRLLTWSTVAFTRASTRPSAG